MPDAIKPDAPAVPPEGAPAPVETRPTEDARPNRAEQMKAVAARRSEELAKMSGAPAVAPEPATTPLDAATQVEKQTTGPIVIDEADLDRYVVSTKIMGKEELAPISKVRAGYQKNESADQYLRDSKELYRELKELKEKSAAAPPPPPAAKPEPPEDVQETARKVVKAMFEGDETNAIAALSQIIQGRQSTTPAVDLDAAMRDVEDRVERRVESRIVQRSALQDFVTTHAATLKDPYMGRLAQTFLLEETGGVPLDQVDPKEIPVVLEKVGQRTEEWVSQFKAPAAGTTTQSATTRDERRKAKEGIDEVPTAATRAASTVPTPKSPSDIIASMATSRGQKYAGTGS